MIECSFPLVALAKRSALDPPTGLLDLLDGLGRFFEAMALIYEVVLVYAAMALVVLVAQVILLFRDDGSYIWGILGILVGAPALAAGVIMAVQAGANAALGLLGFGGFLVIAGVRSVWVARRSL